MHQSNKEALIEVLTGVLTILLICFGVIGAVLVLKVVYPDSVLSEQSEVVGKYRECDVVRWRLNQGASSVYLLHCPKF